MKINNLYEFMRERGFDEKTVKDIERTVYKYTNCGAWFSFEGRSNGGWDHWGEVQLKDDPLYNSGGTVTVGSIVEGVDYGTDEHTNNDQAAYTGFGYRTVSSFEFSST